MSKLYNLDFSFGGNHEIMKFSKDEFMLKVFKEYASKINEDIKNLFFFFNTMVI